MRVESAKWESVGDGEALYGGDCVEKDDEWVNKPGAGRVEVCRPSILGRHADGEICDWGQDTPG